MKQSILYCILPVVIGGGDLFKTFGRTTPRTVATAVRTVAIVPKRINMITQRGHGWEPTNEQDYTRRNDKLRFKLWVLSIQLWCKPDPILFYEKSAFIYYETVSHWKRTSYNGSVSTVREKNGIYSGQIKALNAKLTNLKY